MRQVHVPEVAIQGRAGALHTRTCACDYLFLVYYFPPKPRRASRAVWKHYNDTVQRIADFIAGVLQHLPSRVTEFIGGDTNDTFGHAGEGDRQVGPHLTGDEGPAATALRTIMEARNLPVANSWYASEPTFYGGSPSSIIDNIIKPFEFCASMLHAGTLIQDGGRLHPAHQVRATERPLSSTSKESSAAKGSEQHGS